MPPTPGYLTLSDIAARTPILDVACRRCPRRGRYHTAKLLERYGPDKPGPELLREMSADCPRRLDPSPSIELADAGAPVEVISPLRPMAA